MATGGPGGPGASVLAHVGEEYSLPIATAITQHPGTVAATAPERGPFTDPAVLHPAPPMVGRSLVSATACVVSPANPTLAVMGRETGEIAYSSCTS